MAEPLFSGVPPQGSFGNRDLTMEVTMLLELERSWLFTVGPSRGPARKSHDLSSSWLIWGVAKGCYQIPGKVVELRPSVGRKEPCRIPPSSVWVAGSASFLFHARSL